VSFRGTIRNSSFNGKRGRAYPQARCANRWLASFQNVTRYCSMYICHSGNCSKKLLLA
jgi:hypothetical protein